MSPYRCPGCGVDHHWLACPDVEESIFPADDPEWQDEEPAPTLSVVTVSSIFEETPEGLYRMDRIQRAEDERRSALSPWEREVEDVIDAEITRRVLFGGPLVDPSAPRVGQILSHDRTPSVPSWLERFGVKRPAN